MTRFASFLIDFIISTLNVLRVRTLADYRCKLFECCCNINNKHFWIRPHTHIPTLTHICILIFTLMWIKMYVEFLNCLKTIQNTIKKSIFGFFLKLKRKFFIQARNFESFILNLCLILAWFMLNRTSSHISLIKSYIKADEASFKNDRTWF